MSDPTDNVPKGLRLRWPIVVLAIVALGLIAYDHRAHVLSVLPYLLLLACPFLHVFHGHGHSHAQHKGEENGRRPRGD